MKVAYWIDDTQQQALCDNPEVKGQNPVIAEKCEEGKPLIKSRDSQAMLLTDKFGNIYAGARGTESFLDVVTDVMILDRKDWAGGEYHPGFMKAYKSIQPFWPLIATFIESRKIDPATIEEAIATEFSTEPSQKRALNEILPMQAKEFDEFNQLSMAQRALIYAQHRMGKLTVPQIAARYGIHENTVNSAIVQGEGIFLDRPLSEEEAAYKKSLRKIARSTLGVSFFGHSLGGALAKIAARDANIHGIPVKEIYVFGAPRMTNTAGANAFDAAPNGESKLADSTYRHVNGMDVVGQLAMILTGDHVADDNERQLFRHENGTVSIYVGLTYAQKRDWLLRKLEDDAFGTTQSILAEALSNHFAANYIEMVNTALRQEVGAAQVKIVPGVSGKQPELDESKVSAVLSEGGEFTGEELQEMMTELKSRS